MAFSILGRAFKTTGRDMVCVIGGFGSAHVLDIRPDFKDALTSGKEWGIKQIEDLFKNMR